MLFSVEAFTAPTVPSRELDVCHWTYVLVPWQKLDTTRWFDGGTPDQAAPLTGVGVMRLGGELALVDVSGSAAGTPQEHLEDLALRFRQSLRSDDA